ncbi:sugar transferase [Deinococcus sp. Leaf326]|uniref:sugar transferase n=1 Tax=Deinococcus sp. Leaf326 TaxID=1736338 RepID=UPI001F44D22F|nr:sugar transferase [Deinococcus sp. Leaf326]
MTWLRGVASSPPGASPLRPVSLSLVYSALFALLAAAFWLILRGQGDTPAQAADSLKFWLVAGLLGLGLGSGRPQRRLLAQHQTLWRWPLASAAVAMLLFAVVGDQGARPALLALPLYAAWWGVGLAVRRWHGRHWPWRVGVLGSGSAHTAGDLLPREGLRYVPVSSQEDWSSSRLDALLLRPGDRLSEEHQRLIAHAQVTKVPIWSKTQLDEEISGKVAVHLIQSEWLDQAKFRSRYSGVKRAFDVSVTLLALPVLLPLAAGVAVTVLFNSGRPVLFWQERVGQGGQPFRIVKFRTMTRDSERSGPAFAQRADLRVTPTGAFLRKFRLDELPQFWNVLRGEMSIIGPRPEQSAFAADFEESIPLYASRHWVRPGITGWAQVNQGYTDNLGQTMEKLRYDFYYIKHLSLRLDLLIVWKTVRTILGGFGAR